MLRGKLHKFVLISSILMTLIVGMGAGMVMDRGLLVAHAQTTVVATPPDFQLITEAWNKIDQHYVDRNALQTKPLTYGAISGMVNALGDTGHSTFMTPEMVKAESNFSRGQFEGIGAQVESKDGHVVIVAPFEDSPAQKAGLRAGHVILKVNGDDMTGMTLESVVSRILGPAGTNVTLTILDPKTEKTFDVMLTRARIAVNNVTWQQVPGTTIAHVRVASFSQGVSRQLRSALTELQQQGMAGIILDLRNNPGGLLSEAVNTTSQFLSEGNVLQEKDAQDQVINVAVRPDGVATKISMVVLVNKGSASASEIVAGALQDYRRATLIGETTFGTGTVLTQFSLSDGSALMLAIQLWLTPNGRVIWHKGIVPDLAVSLSTDARPLTPSTERAMTAEQVRASNDQPLLRALDVFKKSENNFRQIPNRASVDNVLQGAVEGLALELELMMRVGFV